MLFQNCMVNAYRKIIQRRCAFVGAIVVVCVRKRLFTGTNLGPFVSNGPRNQTRD